MNIALIFGPLALLSIFYPSVQGDSWSLVQAEIRNRVYKNLVVIEKIDSDSFILYAIPENGVEHIPILGPFQSRGFGPYSMLLRKIWLNSDAYVTLNFFSITTARNFYRVLNPHHSPTFSHYFKIKELVSYPLDGDQGQIIEENVPKALDIFVLDTPAGVDSKARSYVVHQMDGDQEPILIFHSLELDMTVDGDAIELSIYPRNCTKKFRFRIQFEEPSTAKYIMRAHTILNSSPNPNNLQDLEALPENTYPSLPSNYGPGEPSNTGRH